MDIDPTEPKEGQAQMSLEEHDRHLSKKSCIKCGEDGHTCERTDLACTIREEDDSREGEDFGGTLSKEDDKSCRKSLSPSTATGLLKGRIGMSEVLQMVDSGATFNFINARILARLCLMKEPTEPCEANTNRGQMTHCKEKVMEVKIRVQRGGLYCDSFVLGNMLRRTWLRNIGRSDQNYEEAIDFKRRWTAARQPNFRIAQCFAKKDIAGRKARGSLLRIPLRTRIFLKDEKCKRPYFDPRLKRATPCMQLTTCKTTAMGEAKPPPGFECKLLNEKESSNLFMSLCFTNLQKPKSLTL